MEHDDAWHLTDRVSHETGRGDPFAAAIRATRMPMIITDPNRHDNPIVFVNDAFLELTGYARDEIMGRNCRFLQGADTDPEAVKALAEAIKARQDISIEILNYRKDKTSFWNALYISPVFNQDNVVQFFFASQVNMTALRNEKIETARASAVIRSIVDTVRDPLVILDADLQITLASRNFVRMFGDEEADVIGKRIDELKQGQWNVAALRALLDRVVPDETPFNDFLVEDDFPGLGHRVFKLNARKIHVPGNHTTNLLLAFEDVTDAVAADRHRDMLAAELAHRIKNSLAVISAFVSFEIRRAAKPCVAGYQAMQTRINAVAELYDVIAHSSAFGPVDAPAYLAGIADSIRTSLLGSGSQIDIVVDAEPMHIVAENAVTIGLLVNELATNAVKYAFSEGRGRIVLGFRRRGEDVVLSVEDDGSGFDGSVSRTTPASGMGTRFIDAFVLQIGGTLGRASGPTGTTVTIRLPASILSS